ncbi:hypothetical protein POV26_06115 [Aequorivita todarodis]|uniref:hypothetical protein n=1 Tax=Aequorivita todarodis TaxID=2036821 RepID=UPI00235057B8|nr:hypothetical protein [Aequorivita todarodis]MDC8000602.1 hypothetical protein [Aequorivita todarodis]
MKNMYTPQKWAFLFCCFLSLFSFTGFAQVGIGTTDPKTTLDVNGSLSLRQRAAQLTLGSGNNNNINLGASPYSFYRIAGGGSTFSITGIIPVAGADGQIVILQNTTNRDMTIVHDNISTAANRIYVPGEKNLLVRGRYSTITLQYSLSLQRWVLMDKMNHIETWYHGPVTVNSGYNTYTAIIPEATNGSSASVNFVGNINNADAADLYIEFIETRAGQVVFRIYNDDNNVTGVTFAITINKI